MGTAVVSLHSLVTKLNVEVLQEGMIVAAEVRNLDNMLLLPAGVPLTAKRIDTLRAWGVGEVFVESSDSANELSDPLAKLSPEDQARLIAEVKSLFWRLDENSRIHMEIYNQMLRRRARRLLAN